jgi:hypothetical protein
MRHRVNRPQVINETIDGEAIMINLATGSYYSLDRVGGDLWALVEASLSGEEIVVELGRRYDADENDIRRGVDELLRRLAGMQDLILLDPVHEVDARGWPHLPDRHGANG